MKVSIKAKKRYARNVLTCSSCGAVRGTTIRGGRVRRSVSGAGRLIASGTTAFDYPGPSNTWALVVFNWFFGFLEFFCLNQDLQNFRIGRIFCLNCDLCDLFDFLI